MSEPAKSRIMLGPFAYRLQIGLEPQWNEIVRRVVGFTSSEDQKTFLAQLTLRNRHMLHRTYNFTEFFDSTSGLTMMFQETQENWRTIESRFVTLFFDSGYLFGFNHSIPDGEMENKYLISVSESSIEYGDQKSLWSFPIVNAIVEFGIALQLRFPHLTLDNVIKLPEQIEAVLLLNNITYVPFMLSDLPDEFDEVNTADEDPEFFVRYGRPRVSRTPWLPCFRSDCCHYRLELEVFTPDTAKTKSRLDSSFFEIR